MKNRVLVAYASRYGSTAEIARAVGDALSQTGLDVDVVSAREANDLGLYGAVVLGTSIRMEKPLKDAMDFARRHQSALARMPVALFSAGLFMREDTPENREKTRGFLGPLLNIVPNPVSVEFFGGKLDHGRLNVLLRFAARHDKSGMMQEGDWRNWREIRAWAGQLATHLSQPL